MTIKKAVVIQLSGVGIGLVCSLVNLPFASTVSGTTGEVQWVRTTGEGCACQYVEVANRFFYFSGPTSPAGPGPSSGDMAEVTYLNVSSGPGTDLLSITVSPGAPGSVTYTTPDGDSFQKNQPLHYMGLTGLIVGIVGLVIGSVLVFSAVDRVGSRTTALGIAVAPLTVLGLSPLLAYSADLPTMAVTGQVLTVVWLLSATLAITCGISGWRRNKQDSFARSAVGIAGVVSSVNVLWWIGAFVSVLNRSLY
jgi:hypothetical protein